MIIYGDESEYGRVRVDMADFLKAAAEQEEQWTLGNLFDVQYESGNYSQPIDVTPIQYADHMRLNRYWGEVGELHIAARLYGVNFININSSLDNVQMLYPYSQPDEPIDDLVSLLNEWMDGCWLYL